MNIRIRDLQKGTTIRSTFALAKLQTRTTKTGNPYLHLELSDKTGKITTRVWNENPNSLPWNLLEVGKVYAFTVQVQEYQGELQLVAEHIEIIESYDKSDFIASISEDKNELIAELQNYISRISDPHLKTLTDFFFTNEQFFTRFCEAPAAKSVHDSKLGGLLRHTLRVLRLADFAFKSYKEMPFSQDLVIAGILFHDMEKISEYSYDEATIEFTDEGHFIGHCTLAILQVDRAIQKIPGFPESMRQQLLHLIAAHAAEYDPIRLPGTLEALIMHLCDYYDSQLVHFFQEWEAHAGTGWKKDGITQRWCYFPPFNHDQTSCHENK